MKTVQGADATRARGETREVRFPATEGTSSVDVAAEGDQLFLPVTAIRF